MNTSLVFQLILMLVALLGFFVAGKHLARDIAVVLLDRERRRAAVPDPRHDKAPRAVGQTRTEEERS